MEFTRKMLLILLVVLLSGCSIRYRNNEHFESCTVKLNLMNPVFYNELVFYYEDVYVIYDDDLVVFAVGLNTTTFEQDKIELLCIGDDDPNGRYTDYSVHTDSYYDDKTLEYSLQESVKIRIEQGERTFLFFDVLDDSDIKVFEHPFNIGVFDENHTQIGQYYVPENLGYNNLGQGETYFEIHLDEYTEGTDGLDIYYLNIIVPFTVDSEYFVYSGEIIIEN